jgi:putative colanic acid biosynthesis acetyltransferase WcaF
MLFRALPRPFWGLRSALLRAFGARVGRDVRLHPTVRIAIPWTLTLHDGVGIGDRAILYALGPIEVGAAATVSQGAHLCAGSHDHRDPGMPLLRPPIRIGAGAWICADAFIGPGVKVGPGAVVGARAVVTRDVAPDCVVAGNPARPVGPRTGSAAP